MSYHHHSIKKAFNTLSLLNVTTNTVVVVFVSKEHQCKSKEFLCEVV